MVTCPAGDREAGECVADGVGDEFADHGRTSATITAGAPSSARTRRAASRAGAPFIRDRRPVLSDRPSKERLPQTLPEVPAACCSGFSRHGRGCRGSRTEPGHRFVSPLSVAEDREAYPSGEPLRLRLRCLVAVDVAPPDVDKDGVVVGWLVVVTGRVLKRRVTSACVHSRYCAGTFGQHRFLQLT